MENRLPVISLSESGGANLNYATDIFVPGARGFANQARMSAAGIPQITVVHGNATAGARLPARPFGLRHRRARPVQDVPRRPAAA